MTLFDTFHIVYEKMVLKEYWEDSRWAHDHISDLAKEYPNLWVAVVDKRVVASGKVIEEVERLAQEKTGRTEFPVILVNRHCQSAGCHGRPAKMTRHDGPEPAGGGRKGLRC